MWLTLEPAEEELNVRGRSVGRPYPVSVPVAYCSMYPPGPCSYRGYSPPLALVSPAPVLLYDPEARAAYEYEDAFEPDT